MANHLDLEEQEQLDQLKHLWNTWGTLISSVLLVVTVSLVGWNGYQYWQNRQASQAAALYDAVDVAARAGDQGRMAQAFGDLKAKYAGTTQASQAGLALAKTLVEAGNEDGAKEVLAWVASQSGDEGLKALARLRLASVLMDQKNYDEALKQLSSGMPLEFEATAADRRGDIYLSQDKRAEAVAEYSKAYKLLEDSVEYRRLVEVKLGALGVSPQSVAVAEAAAAEGVKKP
ncbi:MAG: tetratricopeptide repeat protein [Acidovorax sp.]|uniref:YfgM family protein n=1 Tax=Acidovorax sp. TaxID=1872122 RepID=UPI0025BA9CE1|nr:tetratricopeptide repeat protein [Acidovorax sp.]MCE1192618.1 tetratricopeptide repeat protein [Acidovorax sp.]